MSDCPCGSGKSYEACCGPIIEGTQKAATAEAVMRSRYSAYTKHAYAHLERTLSAEQRKDFSAEDTKKWAENSEWLGLTVMRTEAGGPEDTSGLVEFSARFKANGQEHEHVEIAKFEKTEGEWLYAGMLETHEEPFRREAPKVGRNDPCPCGSGKKYKKCCGAGK
jgi:SEC-C motif-containing protein